jgi:hypothetical protein
VKRFGYYAQGVSVSTAVLPTGWRDRLVHWQSTATGRAAPVFIDKHDLVVSKLVAMREKHVTFAAALIKAGLIDVDTLRSRAWQLPDDLDARATARVAFFLDHAS